MTTPTDGTLPNGQEPALTGTPAQAEAPQQQAPAAPEASPQQPQLPAEIQQRLAEAERNAKRVEDLERISRQHQSERDRLAQQVQALAGVQPQQDPIAPYLKPYTDMGLEAKDAAVRAVLFK